MTTYARGLYTGYHMGFYEDYTFVLNEACLGQSTLDNMSKFEDHFSHELLDQIFEYIAGVYIGVYLLMSISDETCMIERVYDDAHNHCLEFDCSYATWEQNAGTHAFYILDLVNEIVALSFNKDNMLSNQEDEAFEQMEMLGIHFGKVVRLVIGYEPLIELE